MVHLVQDLVVVLLDVFRVKAQHLEDITWILVAYSLHRSYRLPVDAWHEEILSTSLPGSCYYFIKVVLEFLTVNGTSDSLRTIFKWGDISYTLDGKTLKPTLCISGKTYNGQNRFATADSWATDNHTLTDGKWHKPVRLTACKLNIVHDGRFLTIYRDGLIDQRIECELPKGKPTINK